MLVPRVENGYRKLGDLPGASSENKVEVWSRTAQDGSSLLELIEYSWGSGLGWYIQKRIVLDAGQVEALRALLGEEVAAAIAPRAPRLRPSVVRDENVIRLVFPE
jgi:hypothetical protein